MSPDAVDGFCADSRFPRVSGDEPLIVSKGGKPYVFSPRERG